MIIPTAIGFWWRYLAPCEAKTFLCFCTATAKDEAQWAVRAVGIASVSIEGLAIEQSTSVISVLSPGGGGGEVAVKDCHFKGPRRPATLDGWHLLGLAAACAAKNTLPAAVLWSEPAA